MPVVEATPQVLAASAGPDRRILVDEMKADPLALLDCEMRDGVEPALGELGRRFVLDDFEAQAPRLALQRNQQSDATAAYSESVPT